MNNITRKLTSRKFWLSVASFVSMLAVYMGATDNQSTQIASLIMAGASVIGYTLGEGFADSGHFEDSTSDEYYDDTEV